MSLALYRKYRPATFAEVVGQEHVTEPLQQALRTGRVHHAYLFSGPRGCGKTSSARILARSLNCEQGPTPTPCGTCDSCVALAPNGPGSIDVVEIDAATHGLVDDARELREKAVYAPAQSQFRVYIIDEAHQLGPGAANALLKIIEEPPPYLKFIFATTEPEKIIGTIRSRTHHYPFRLVPPGVLTTHLASICESEGVAVADGVLPLVVRAGAGSVRDSLSVLDQLIAATGDEGITYPLATALLGFTPATLLDQTVDAVAARDGAALFATVDRVVEGGVDPRRYAGDLLERWRDLMVISQIPDAVEQDLLHHPPDTLELMAAQAGRFSFAELTRAADVTAAALNELKGATSPRLQLEILVARLMLTAADSSDLGIVARLAQVERLAAAGAFAGPIPPVIGEPPVSSPAPAERAADSAPGGPPAAKPTPAAAAPETPAAAAPPAQSDGALDREEASAVPDPSDHLPGPEAAPSAGAGGTQLQRVRVLWADVLEAVKNRSRVSWMMLFEKAQVLDLEGSVLTLALGKPGDVKAFNDGGHGERVRQALIDVAGMDLAVQAVLNPSAAASGSATGGASRGTSPSVGAGRSGSGTSRPTATGTDASSGAAGDTGANSARPGRPAGRTVAPAAGGDQSDFGEEPDPDDEVESTDPEAVLRALGATPVQE